MIGSTVCSTRRGIRQLWLSVARPLRYVPHSLQLSLKSLKFITKWIVCDVTCNSLITNRWQQLSDLVRIAIGLYTNSIKWLEFFPFNSKSLYYGLRNKFPSQQLDSFWVTLLLIDKIPQHPRPTPAGHIRWR
jgi:hypothetical protein